MDWKIWRPPCLLILPRIYDTLFQRYHLATCARCGTSPKEPLICLICGDIICYRERECCRTGNMSEIETHTLSCGGGTCLYLNVHTSLVVVVRQKRAAFWGSVYLDSHGEEDRGLKRGKPMLLSEERADLLEKQWLSHNLDGACKRWQWLSNPNPTVIPMT